jgi:hypothetical protein
VRDVDALRLKIIRGTVTVILGDLEVGAILRRTSEGLGVLGSAPINGSIACTVMPLSARRRRRPSTVHPPRRLASYIGEVRVIALSWWRGGGDQRPSGAGSVPSTGR